MHISEKNLLRYSGRHLEITKAVAIHRKFKFTLENEGHIFFAIGVCSFTVFSTYLKKKRSAL